MALCTRSARIMPIALPGVRTPPCLYEESFSSSSCIESSIAVKFHCCFKASGKDRISCSFQFWAVLKGSLRRQQRQCTCPSFAKFPAKQQTDNCQQTDAMHPQSKHDAEHPMSDTNATLYSTHYTKHRRFPFKTFVFAKHLTAHNLQTHNHTRCSSTNCLRCASFSVRELDK